MLSVQNFEPNIDSTDLNSIPLKNMVNAFKIPTISGQPFYGGFSKLQHNLRDFMVIKVLQSQMYPYVKLIKQYNRGTICKDN